MQWGFTGLSMWPAIRPGDECRVQAVDPGCIRVGDIILATRENRLFAHRVVSIDEGPPRAFLMKGDTLLYPDAPVQQEDLLGQVIGIERKGRYASLLAPRARQLGRMMAAVSRPYSRLFLYSVLLRRRAIARMADLAAVRRRRKARAGALTARPATMDDAPGLAVLLAEGELSRLPPGHGIDMDLMQEKAREMVEGAERAGARVWVVDVDGFVAGCAVIGPLGPPLSEVGGWWVMSVYVKMTARGRGIAEAIVRAGLRDAAANGIAVVRYAAYAGNEPSLTLARKCGFVPDDSAEARRFAECFAPHGSGASLVVMAAATRNAAFNERTLFTWGVTLT